MGAGPMFYIFDSAQDLVDYVFDQNTNNHDTSAIKFYLQFQSLPPEEKEEFLRISIVDANLRPLVTDLIQQLKVKSSQEDYTAYFDETTFTEMQANRNQIWQEYNLRAKTASLGTGIYGYEWIDGQLQDIRVCLSEATLANHPESIGFCEYVKQELEFIQEKIDALTDYIWNSLPPAVQARSNKSSFPTELLKKAVQDGWDLDWLKSIVFSERTDGKLQVQISFSDANVEATYSFPV